MIIEDHHVERLQNNECSVQSGISLKEILNSTDRIAGHCVNISVFLVQRLNDPYKFDAHQHLMQDHQEMTEEYKGLYGYYEAQYLKPIQEMPAIEKTPQTKTVEPVVETAVKEKDPAKKKEKDKVKDKDKAKDKAKDKDKAVKKDKKGKNGK